MEGREIITANMESLLEEYASRLEERLATESQNFRTLADSLPQIVWTTARDGRLEYFNQRWYDYTGYTEEQTLRGFGWTNLIHKDDLAGNEEAWERSLATGEEFHYEHRLFDRRTGGYRWFLSRSRPGLDKDGKIYRWFGSSTDIDEHKRAEEQKDSFLAIASHELKTPVTSIKAFTQILQRRLDKAGDHASVKHLAKMNVQIDKLTELIRELLDISKLDSGRFELRRKRFNFDEFLADLIETQQMINELHHFEIEGQPVGEVYADQERLEQVLVNFFTNAVKYSPQADRVVIKVRTKDHQLEVGVQDFGLGIAKADQERVFDRFYRVAGPRSETFPGLGLGLYIASQIIRRHGGKVWIKSQEGKGSTFYLSLPLEEPAK